MSARPLLRSETVGGLPLVTVTGDPHTLGGSLGKRLKPYIEVLAQECFELLRRDTPDLSKVSGPGETALAHKRLRRLLEPGVEPMRRVDPVLWRELSGIAEGAKVDLDDLLLINAWTDLLGCLGVQTPPTDGATLILGPQQVEHGRKAMAGCLLIDPALVPYLVVVRRMPENAPATLILTLAGLHPIAGLSEAGLALASNELRVTDGVNDGLPTTFILGSLLNVPTFEEARLRLATGTRLGGRCYHLLADDGRRLSVECSGRLARILADPQKDAPRVHTNHPIDPDIQAVCTILADPYSQSRLGILAHACINAHEVQPEDIAAWFKQEPRRITGAWHHNTQLGAVFMLDPKLRSLTIGRPEGPLGTAAL